MNVKPDAMEGRLSIRLDKADKRRFKALCDEKGMNVSFAIQRLIKTEISKKDKTT